MNPRTSLHISRSIWTGWRIAATIAALGLAFVRAQSTAPAGILAGRVINKASGSYLPDARIEIKGTTLSTTVDRSGAFLLPVPAGNHTVQVSYVGLDTAVFDVNVEPGKRVERIVELTSQLYQMEAFTVTGEREARMLALQSQRESDSQKTVVSTDAYGNPASNPGELLNRLPEITADIVGNEVRSLYVRGMAPDFSQLLIDGQPVASSTGSGASRIFQIEQYGTANLAMVELIKSTTPEMDAGAVAGAINLVTKTAFDAPRRRTQLTVGTVWRDRHSVSSSSPLADRADGPDILSFSHSDAYSIFGGRRNLGVTLDVSRGNTSTTQDEIGPAGLTFGAASDFFVIPAAAPAAYQPPAGVAPVLERVWGTGDLLYETRTFNVGVSLKYKATDNLVLGSRLFFNKNDQQQRYFREQLTFAAPTAANIATIIGPGSTWYDQTVLPHAAAQANSYTGVLTKHSKNYGANLTVDWRRPERDIIVNAEFNHSWADIRYPGNYQIISRIPNIGWRLLREGGQIAPGFQQTAGPDITDPANYRFASYNTGVWRAPNYVTIAKADVQKSYRWAAPTTFKAGARFKQDRRESDQLVGNYTWSGGTGIGPYVAYHYRQGRDLYGPFPFVYAAGEGRPPATEDPAWTISSADAYNSHVTTMNSKGKAREEVSAGYWQARSRFGKLLVLGGLRVERTDLEVATLRREINPDPVNGTTSITALPPAQNLARAMRRFPGDWDERKRSYSDVFPGLHFVYEPFPEWELRASVNKTISRPNMTVLLPNMDRAENAAGLGTITMGNPELKPYTSINQDYSISRYIGSGGVMAIGAFDKRIKDYSQSVNRIISADDPDLGHEYAGWTLTRRENIGDAHVQGVSFNYSQNLKFLPGAWKGLGLSASYTYLRCKGTFDGQVERKELANFSPRSGNAQVYWQWKGFDFRYLVNWRGQTIFQGGSGGLTTTYHLPRLIQDVKLRYVYGQHWEFALNIANLTNHFTTGYGVARGDIRYYSAQQGTTYNCGATYKF